MAELERFLFQNYEDLSTESQHPHKKAGLITVL